MPALVDGAASHGGLSRSGAPCSTSVTVHYLNDGWIEAAVALPPTVHAAGARSRASLAGGVPRPRLRSPRATLDGSACPEAQAAPSPAWSARWRRPSTTCSSWTATPFRLAALDPLLEASDQPIAVRDGTRTPGEPPTPSVLVPHDGRARNPNRGRLERGATWMNSRGRPATGVGGELLRALTERELRGGRSPASTRWTCKPCSSPSTATRRRDRSCTATAPLVSTARGVRRRAQELTCRHPGGGAPARARRAVVPLAEREAGGAQPRPHARGRWPPRTSWSAAGSPRTTTSSLGSLPPTGEGSPSRNCGLVLLGRPPGARTRHLGIKSPLL